MKIISLVENTPGYNSLPVEHGLSLFISLDSGCNILFDMGQSDLFLQNAQSLGIDISTVDIAVISHGHYDHGGGLSHFINTNNHAKIYIHNQAFKPHFSMRDNAISNIGINPELEFCNRITLCNNTTTEIAPGVILFANVSGKCLCPPGNNRLFNSIDKTPDDFCHEQNLIITEGDNSVLLAGCAHRGIINIMHRALEVTNREITHVLAGMHLKKNGLDDDSETQFIKALSKELLKFNGCHYYTMHCTGLEPYAKLKTCMGDAIDYFACGDTLTIK